MKYRLLLIFLWTVFPIQAADLELTAPQSDQELSILQPCQTKFLNRAEDLFSGRTKDPDLHYPEKFSTKEYWKHLKGQEKDLSFPKPILFSWALKKDQPEKGTPDFTVQISRSHSFQPCFEKNCGSETQTKIDNFRSGTHYYWRIKYKIGDGSERYSTVAEFRTKAEAPRWIRVPGMSNVRDLGGWKGTNGFVRQEMIYRGSEMDAHMKMREEGKSILLNDLKIQTDLDLRGLSELGSQPGNYYSPLGKKVNWLSVPLSSYANIFNESGKKQYKKIFDALDNKKNYPLYIHCWGGADRTGTLIFMIQSVLGLSDRDLIADYEETSFAVFGVRSRDSKQFQEFLQKLNEFGQKKDSLRRRAELFLLSCGISQDQIDRFRTIMTESDQSAGQ